MLLPPPQHQLLLTKVAPRSYPSNSHPYHNGAALAPTSCIISLVALGVTASSLLGHDHCHCALTLKFQRLSLARVSLGETLATLGFPLEWNPWTTWAANLIGACSFNISPSQPSSRKRWEGVVVSTSRGFHPSPRETTTSHQRRLPPYLMKLGTTNPTRLCRPIKGAYYPSREKVDEET